MELWVDIITSLQNLIEYGDMMGFGSDSYQVLWLGFEQQELPESLSSIVRFSGNTDRVFSSITIADIQVRVEVP